MTLARTGDLVAEARDAGRGLAAVNAITLEHTEAVVAAAERHGGPVVLQLSENAVRFHGALRPLLAAMVACAEDAAVPVALHLDHVTDDSLFEQALAAPLSSVMYDAGALPYADNLARTARAARQAHEAGLWLEAELGFVGGKAGPAESAHSKGVRTDPVEAAAFVAATGVDALAVAVGSSHHMTTRTASLDLDLVAALHEALDVPLVLHGSSGVPPALLRGAVRSGITKINLGTALNQAMTGVVRDRLQDPDLVDPRRYLAPARDAMAEVVLELLENLADAGG